MRTGVDIVISKANNSAPWVRRISRDDVLRIAIK